MKQKLEAFKRAIALEAGKVLQEKEGILEPEQEALAAFEAAE